MDQFVQRVFLEELKLQCQFIALASEQLQEVQARDAGYHRNYEREREAAKRALKAAGETVDAQVAYSQRLHPLRHGYPKDSIERSWTALQTIAVSAANLSKLLWGSGKRKGQEREPLRELLAIEDGSCFESPDLRNDFEHFDERIERRIVDQRNTGYIGRNIGPLGMIQVRDEEPNTRFGHYDPETGELSFWANSINVFDIAAEAQRILSLAERELRKPLLIE